MLSDNHTIVPAEDRVFSSTLLDYRGKKTLSLIHYPIEKQQEDTKRKLDRGAIEIVDKTTVIEYRNA